MATVAELAAKVGLPFEGDGALEIVAINGLQQAGKSDLSFVQSEKYRDAALSSPVRAVVAPEGLHLPGKTVIRSPDPYLTLAQLTALIHPPAERRPGIDPRAVIGEDCRIDPDAAIHPLAVLGKGVTVGAGCEIHPGAYLGDGVVLGDACEIHPNVTIEWGCLLGSRVIVHAGTVIGSDGFGLLQTEGRHIKVPHVGNVVIGDDVEIGSNCAIDRATYDSTTIGDGTKMDNLVHIAHNVEVGPLSRFAGQSGVAGTTKLGAHFLVGGQSGIVGHLVIPERVTLGPKSMMTRAGIPGEVYAGIPARPMRDWSRSVAHFHALPKLVKRINRLLGSRGPESGDDTAED